MTFELEMDFALWFVCQIRDFLLTLIFLVLVSVIGE